jgi:hypothetical protein
MLFCLHRFCAESLSDCRKFHQQTLCPGVFLDDLQIRESYDDNVSQSLDVNARTVSLTDPSAISYVQLHVSIHYATSATETPSLNNLIVDQF